MENKENVIEIDLMQVFSALWHHLGVLILAAIIGGGLLFSYSSFVITPQYESSVMLYVNNTAADGNTSTINNADLTAAKSLTDTYIVILKSWPVLEEVSKEAKVTYDADTLGKMISANDVNNTEVFSVKVKSTDPEEAQRIANAVAKVLPGKIAEVVTGSSVRVVSEAQLPTEKCSPNIKKNTVMGAAVGFILACLIVIIRTLMDTKIHDEDYLTETYNLPVLAVIPDLLGGSDKKHSKKGAKKRNKRR